MHASHTEPAPSVALRVLDAPTELAELCELIADVFGEPVPNVIDIRGSLLAGGVCIGAFAEDQMVGGLWSFAGWDERGPFQHSHTMCVSANVQGRGIGRTLKRFHAEWCRDRAIDRICWTFDPLMAGNARFNLNRIGAVGDRWIEDCYGSMSGLLDPASRTGGAAPSDRLSVTWVLSGARVEAGKTTTLVGIPPTGNSPEALSAEEAVLRLRIELQPLIDAGAIVTGVERLGDGWAYRVEHRNEEQPCV